jgi:CelD/BcsL family acetyltransferase involved in cellulose biosynthesis
MKVVDLSPGEWTALLKVAPSVTIFHTNEWLTVLERTYGCEFRRLGFVNGGHLVGGIPVSVRRKFIYRIAGSPASGMVTPYQGPVCEDVSKSGTIFEAFWRYAVSMGWDFVEVTPAPDSPLLDWRRTDLGVRCEARQTICLDLTRGETNLFQGMEKDCRNKVRQGEKRGAVVTEVGANGNDWIGPFYDAKSELYRRQHRPPSIPRAFFENLQDVFAARGTLKIFIATYENEMIAGAVALVDEGTLYGCDRVSRSAYNYLRPNNLIDWAIIRWACRQGLRTLDMMGGNIPGITHYKEGFGGRFVPYVTFQRTSGWPARFGERGYKLLAPLARRVAARLNT